MNWGKLPYVEKKRKLEIKIEIQIKGNNSNINDNKLIQLKDIVNENFI